MEIGFSGFNEALRLEAAFQAAIVTRWVMWDTPHSRRKWLEDCGHINGIAASVAMYERMLLRSNVHVV